MSTEPDNNHSNNGTRNAGIALGFVSVIVALFYFLEYLSGYELPDWLTFIILLAAAFVFVIVALLFISVDLFGYKLLDWFTSNTLLEAAVVSVVSVGIVTFITLFFAKKIANSLGKEEFHTDIKLFIFPLIVFVIASMFEFKYVNSNCENTDNVIVATCKSNAIKDTKDSGNKAEINKKKQICMNQFFTFAAIAAISCIAKVRKTSMKNEYDETKIELDYMHERNRYVNYDSNNPNSVVEERKEFTEKKETLKYYSSMKNNYEAITFFFAFASLIMGFSKLG